MDVLYTHCAGLDVHKKTVVACCLTPGPDGTRAAPDPHLLHHDRRTCCAWRIG